MKTELKLLAAACAAITAVPPALAAATAEKSESKPRAELRVLSTAPERRVLVERAGDKAEKEKVAFLGVETGQVSATTAAQLGLPRGTGLVVNSVVPKSPAAGVLQEHDILLKLDDQILIETRQLAVLVRIKKPGEEVALTYLRAGQRSAVRITLGEHEVPKMSALAGADFQAFALASAAPVFEHVIPVPGGGREETDRTLSLIERARAARGPSGQQPPVRIQIDRAQGPGLRAISINTADSTLAFTDEAGTLELTLKAGAKTLVARDAKGAELFAGPVTTPEERKALPAAVRARLEQLEAMRDVTFRTDGDFKGAETRVVRPLERSISFPRPAVPAGAPRPAVL
jgi:serine protease Do